MEMFRCVFKGTQRPKTEKERGKMKGRIPIKAITMADTRPGPSSSNTKTETLEFYKIMVGDFQKRLRIPHAFIKHISKELPGRAVLEVPSGNCWLVELSSTKSGVYFKDGWETFQKDHSLTLAEFVVFKYNGDMHFKVLIFGVNGCERCDTYVVEPSQGLTFGKGKKCQSPRGDKGKSIPLPRSERIVLPEEEKPQFPYFLRTITVSYVKKPFVMYVPSRFAREHLSKDTTMVRLEDKMGNSWEVNLQVGPIHTTLRIGWKNFVEDNHLEVGDSIKFQLVRKDVMKVKIYRGYSEA